MTMIGKPVVVTTSHQGVFGGILKKQTGTIVELATAQMCVYWSPDVQGVVGLAATGPTKNCRVTRPAPRILLTDVTSVAEMTSEAQTAWTKRPWA